MKKGQEYKSDKSIYNHEAVGHKIIHEEAGDNESKVTPNKPVYYNQNNRDVNADVATEGAQEYLSDLNEAEVREGHRKGNMDVQFGRPNTIKREKVIEDEAEFDSEEENKAKGPMGRTMNSDHGVY